MEEQTHLKSGNKSETENSAYNNNIPAPNNEQQNSNENYISNSVSNSTIAAVNALNNAAVIQESSAAQMHYQKPHLVDSSKDEKSNAGIYEKNNTENVITTTTKYLPNEVQSKVNQSTDGSKREEVENQHYRYVNDSLNASGENKSTASKLENVSHGREGVLNTSALTAANTVAAASVEKFKQHMKSFSESSKDPSLVVEDKSANETFSAKANFDSEQQNFRNRPEQLNNVHDFTPLQIVPKPTANSYLPDVHQAPILERNVSNVADSNLVSDAPEQENTNGEMQVDSNMDANENGMYRPLNVKDALSYLEEVKLQFYNRPAVYNSFLDIMKEFKAQTIDTPGVIERVSTLFTEYPLLIQGFNTFLPQGYKIEYSNVPGDPFPVKVVTPYSGGAVELNAGVIHAQQQEAQQLQLQQAEQQQNISDTQNIPETVETENENLQEQNYSQVSQNQQFQQQQQQQQQEEEQQQQQPIQEQQGDVEFSHAISYVNKIKTRFNSEPNVYKQFLEILQTYQTDQKPIQEVYDQVTVLFQGAPDLLDDFKKFLPDTNQEAQYNQQQVEQQKYLQSAPEVVQQYDNQINPEFNGTNQMPPLGSFSPPKQPQALDNNILDEQIQHNMIAQNGGHLVTASGNNEIPISNTRGEPLPDELLRQREQQLLLEQQQQQQQQQLLLEQQQQFENNMSMQQQTQQQGILERPEIDLDPSLVPVIPEPLEPVESELEINDEVHFFEKVKKLLGSKQTYQEFVKLLHLYTQDLISKNDLIIKAAQFIETETELFDWFKMFVGYEELPKEIENIVYEKHKVDLDLCEACGPSYKKLPKSDTFMPCSGRDEMCWEVLNDEWVGHPVWASEESGFIAHRKNQYEETLFKTEEERHEYDFYIEANLRTIQTLEVINNKINSMTQEEKAAFRLPEGLGATSMTIYKKVIRKIYEKERGFEIIEAIHEHPAQTVPVVLNRLKQKDEEWRRNQREWNKIWREVEQKVYYKSLDHMGLTFKQTDKKLLLTKQLLADICTIKDDPLSKENVSNTGPSKRWNPLIRKSSYELKYQFSDKNIIFDILYLCSVYIINVSTYSQSDKEKIQRFLYWFVSKFFNIPLEDIIAFTVNDERVKSFTNNNVDTEIEAESGDKRSRTLLDEYLDTFEDLELFSDVFKTRFNKKTNGKDDSTSNEDAESSKTTDTEIYESFKDSVLKSWIGDDAGNLDCNSKDITDEMIDSKNRNRYISYGNIQIYLLIRFFSIMYDRLLEVKKIDSEITEDIKNRKYDDYIDPMFLSSKQLEDRGLSFKGDSAYSKLIDFSSEFIQGKIDNQWFEESIRQAYKNKAFKLATIDKVIQHLVKQSQNCTTDKKSQSLMKLFEYDRGNSCLKISEQVIYKIQVRKVLDGNDLMFSFDFNNDTNQLSMKYIKIDDIPIKEADSDDSEQRWKSYVASYKLSYSTEGGAAAVSSDIVFDKNEERELSDDIQPSLDGVIEKSKLALDISKDDYKATLGKDSASVFIQTQPQTNENKDQEVISEKNESTNVSNWLEQKKFVSRKEDASLSIE